MADIPRIIKEELDTLTSRGVAWEITDGSKHLKIKVKGKLAGILSRGNNDREPRSQKNLRASIRRLSLEGG